MSDDYLSPGPPRSWLTLRRGSEIQIAPVSWIWPGWLATGKLHMLGGVAGTGKTTIALSLAATLTRGGVWPDGTRCTTPGSVVIWSGEDDPADTLMPRLTAMGADPERVHIVSHTHYEGRRREFDPAHDMALLIEAANKVGDVKLLLVDPVVTSVSGDSHKNAEVRRGLAPLVTFAQQLGAAVVGITHFTKGTAGKDPLDRLTGSLAFGAAPRLVFAVTKVSQRSPTDSATLVFVRVKSNIGPEGNAYGYMLGKTGLPGGIETTRVEWGKLIEGDARSILGSAEDDGQNGDGNTALGDAKHFLLATLKDGPVDAREVFGQAEGAHIAEKTLRRAKGALGVVVAKRGMSAGWAWSLP